ncbi:MAG: hypothetical protein KF908_11750 [Nitrosomonas sp.]|jgi:hypothetical protein|uniref:hypothetical protein n=1 Tax=Nitrosomonas sp. TaxID=42353 RepID=UPI001DF9FEEE|nr:hypothetical protein [Nitrosomonas sp.]MBX3630557.1 hypothetical protein [Nitrosomonas sp.]MDP3279780.1 hypothetical protein [Nitrosomonas sp.]MDP3662551.1 hypothetical protein [Nitrosomonas sp.]MDZ4106938.1 hypothetical protein [Nitrosomonas sp.]
MKKTDELFQIAQTAIYNYSGDIDVLNSALGMLFTGHYYGWRFLYIVHLKQHKGTKSPIGFVYS